MPVHSVVAWAIAYITGIVYGYAAVRFPVTAAGIAAVAAIFSIRRVRPIGQVRQSFWPHLLIVLLFLFGAARIIVQTAPAHSEPLGPFMNTRPAWLRGRIESPPRHRPGETGADPVTTTSSLRLESVRARGREEVTHEKIRLTVRGFDPQLAYGDVIEVFAAIKPVVGFSNPGGFDYRDYMKRHDIAARAVVTRMENFRRLYNDAGSFLGGIYAGREKVRRAMSNSLSPRTAAVLEAMILGEPAFIPPRLREVFMDSGTVHILSISGTHLGLLALIVFTLSSGLLRRLPSGLLLEAGRIAGPRRLAAGLTLVPVIYYTLLSGSQTATVRSLIMITIYLVGVILVRNHDPLHALSLAALVVSLADPRTVLDLSFQLSYGAVLAIVLAVRLRREGPRDPDDPAENRMLGMGRKVRTVLWVTTAAGAGTTPITAHHFNLVGWAGYLANPVILPLVGGVIVPAGLVGSAWVLLTHADVFPLAVFYDSTVETLVRAATLFSKLPAAAVHVPSPPASVIVLWYAAAGVLLLGRFRISARIGIALTAVLLTVPWMAGAGRMGKDRDLKATFIDVGQGDASLVEFPGGKTMLIDGGTRHGSFDVGRLAVAPFLWDKRIHTLDTVVMSHPQADHAGGLEYILRNFNVGEVWINGETSDAAFYKRILATARRNGIPVRTVYRERPEIRPGGAVVRILHPGRARGKLSRNDLSVVLQILYGRRSLLLTGDIETAAERELDGSGGSLKTSVLKVPHHGSRSSIDPGFLARVSPRVAVVSAGPGNRFGHPSPATLEAYRLLGTQLYRTDADGAVIVRTDGNTLDVDTSRDSGIQDVRRFRRRMAREWRNWTSALGQWTGRDPA